MWLTQELSIRKEGGELFGNNIIEKLVEKIVSLSSYVDYSRGKNQIVIK